MSRKNRVPLADRVTEAAEVALAARHFASAIDVLVGIGWLDPGAVERWRRGQSDCLEEVVRVNLPRIAGAMHDGATGEPSYFDNDLDRVDGTIDFRALATAIANLINGRQP